VYLITALLGALMGFYYFVFIPKNEQQINEHADRLLYNKAKTVLEKYQGYQEAINTSPKSYFINWFYKVYQNNNVFIQTGNRSDTLFFSGDSLRLTKPSDKNHAQKTDEVFHGSFSKTKLDAKGIIVKSAPRRFEFEKITKKDFTRAVYDIKLKPEPRGPKEGQRGLHLWQVTSSNNYFIYEPPGTYYDLDNNNKKVEPFQWVNVQDFMGNLKSNDFFEDLFLLSLSDTQDTSSLKVNGFVPDGVVLNQSSLGLVRFAIPDSIKKFGTGFFVKKIAGQSYRVYVKEVQLRRGLSVQLIGLVNQVKLSQQARQVPSWFVVFCLLVALLLFFLLPVIKLFSLNKHERLSATDARLSVFSMILGVSLATIIFLGSYIFWSIEKEQAGEQMKCLARKIKDSTECEIANLLTALNDPTLWKEKSGKENRNTFKHKHPEIKKYNEVFSLDANRNQDGKVNVVFTSSGLDFGLNKFPVNIGKREYFSQMVAAVKDSIKIDYYLQAINSFASGQSEVAISQFWKPDSTIRVITSRMPSVISPIIPAPFRFVVTNRDGDIKFHSEWKELQKENFVSECNDNIDISAYLNNSVQGNLTFTYLGNECDGFGMPLAKGLYLIVYYELQNTRNLAAEVFGLCLITLALVIIIMGLIHICLMQDYIRSSLLKTHSFIYQWLNPQNCDRIIGLKLAIFCLLLFLGQWAWAWFSYSAISSIFIVGLTTAFFYVTCYGTLNNNKPSKARVWLNAFICVMILLLILFTFLYRTGWGWTVMIAYLIALHVLFHLQRWDKVKINLKPYFVYRLFIAGCLLVLAIGPSIIFISGHYYFSSLSSQYGYSVDDVQKLQTKSISDVASLRGVDYTKKPKTHVAAVHEEGDSTFYTYLQGLQPSAESMVRSQLGHLPNQKGYKLFHNRDSAIIEGPASLILAADRPQDSISLYRKIQKLSWVNSVQTITVVFAALLALYGLWKVVKLIPRKIFFAPDKIIWDCYPESEIENFLEREFEYSFQQRHPLHNFDEEEKVKLLSSPELVDLDNYTPEEQRMIRDKYILKLQKAAEHDYSLVWEKCSNEDKYFLYDLAIDGVANQADHVLIGSLAERGLLRLRPKLELVNTSFANYVMNAMTEDELKEWREHESAEGNWGNLRLVLIIVIAGAFIFLSVAEENFLGRVTALVASVGLILPQIVNVVASFGNLFKRV
jgi:hypothetical protein